MTKSHSLEAKPASADVVGATRSSTQPAISMSPTANSGTTRLIIRTMAPSRSHTNAHRGLAPGQAASTAHRPATPTLTTASPRRGAAGSVGRDSADESLVRPVESRVISVDSRGPAA